MLARIVPTMQIQEGLPSTGQGYIIASTCIKERRDVHSRIIEMKKRIKVEIELFKESWEWFFDTIHNNKNSIERADGKSNGNFWTILQLMEESYEKSLPEERLIKSIEKPKVDERDMKILNMMDIYIDDETEKNESGIRGDNEDESAN
jgi:hypothetical protein